MLLVKARHPLTAHLGAGAVEHSAHRWAERPAGGAPPLPSQAMPADSGTKCVPIWHKKMTRQQILQNAVVAQRIFWIYSVQSGVRGAGCGRHATSPGFSGHERDSTRIWYTSQLFIVVCK